MTEQHTIASSPSSGAVPRRAAVAGPAGELAMELDGIARVEQRGHCRNRNEEQKLGPGSRHSCFFLCRLAMLCLLLIEFCFSRIGL